MAPNTEIEIFTQEKCADKVVNALKALVKTALCNGFSKTSYLVTDHIKYIKKIESRDNPEAHIRFTARKLFPNEPAYLEKIKRFMPSIRMMFYPNLKTCIHCITSYPKNCPKDAR